MDNAYYQWIREQALLIGSDGCTGVKDIHVECCYEHDLAYRTHRDPRLAYVHGWMKAPLITKKEADARFKQCNMKRSWFKWLSPLALWRWFAVDTFGDMTEDPGPYLAILTEAPFEIVVKADAD